jgi:hypothetical protein
MEYKVGTRVDHEKYGVGIVSENTFSQVKIIFIRGGEVQFSKSNLLVDILSTPDDENAVVSNSLSLEDVEKAIEGVLSKYNSLEKIIPMGEKWEGGTMLLQPANKSLKPKEIPVEAFFHKIVMVRDRLRVLEQNINSNTKLSDEEKINLQQYITRIYGSLTTFNVLFDDKEYYFVGQKGE